MQSQAITSNIGVTGSRQFKITRGGPHEPAKTPRLRDLLRARSLPNTGIKEVDDYRLRNLPNLLRGLAGIGAARLVKVPTFYGVVSAKVTRANGDVIDLGIISCRVVTTAGVNKIVAFLNAGDTATGQTFKFHGFGTGTTAEAPADTALVTELTTEYAVDNTRPTGSQTTGGSSNVYRSIGTLSPDATCAITEHGLFSASSAGTLLDRSKFSVINLLPGDSLQITYDGTFAAGG